MNRAAAVALLHAFLVTPAWCGAQADAAVDPLGPGRTIVMVKARDPNDYATGLTNISISDDGTVLVFESYVPGLVPEDTNDRTDVFAYDIATERTELMSAGPDGKPGDKRSSGPCVSADGRFVAFLSGASNLVADTTHEWSRMYVHDRTTKRTTRSGCDTHVIYHFSGGWTVGPLFFLFRESPEAMGRWARAVREKEPFAASSDGRYVAYMIRRKPGEARAKSFRRGLGLYDCQTRAVERIASELVDGKGVSMSRDGRFVCFTSGDPRLVTQKDKGDNWDTFVYDRLTRTTEWVSTRRRKPPADGSGEAGWISGDGRFVVYCASVPPHVRGRARIPHIYVLDRTTSRHAMVDVNSEGIPGDQPCSSLPKISGNGRFVVFRSRATNLVPVVGRVVINTFVARNPLVE